MSGMFILFEEVGLIFVVVVGVGVRCWCACTTVWVVDFYARECDFGIGWLSCRGYREAIP